MTNIVRRFFEKAKRYTAVLLSDPTEVTWPLSMQDYKALADEGYTQCSEVYACINLKAKTCKGVPWLVYRKKGKKLIEVEDFNDPLIKLIRRPNSQQSFAKLIENLVAFYEISGNSYLYRVGPGPKDPPQQLWNLRPDRVKVIPNKQQGLDPISHYVYTIKNEGTPLKPDRVINTDAWHIVKHIKCFHPLDDLYGLCYSDDHEILTEKRGWKLFSDLKLEDRVATRNPITKELEWQIPTAYINHEYNGKMINFKGRSIDLLVTPKHRMAVAYKKNGKFKERIISAKQYAEEIKNNKRQRPWIPLTSEWVGKEIKEVIFPQNDKPRKWGSNNIDWTFRISGDDYCALMGAYLAEGNIRHQGGIEINQRHYSKGYKLYKKLIKRINGKSGHNGKAFIIGRTVLTEHFKRFGLSYEKYIPTNIRNTSKRQLKIFWDHYIAGDGYISQVPNTSGRSTLPRDRYEFGTVSKRLADNLVEVAQKLGWSAGTHEHPARITKICGVKARCRKGWRIRVRYMPYMKVSEYETIHYSGTIHCVTVPNGIVYVRRNGKPLWCGNSPIRSGARVIDQINEAAKLNYGLLKNGARPSGAFISKGSHDETTEVELKRQLQENYSGSQNAGKQLLLSGDLDWKEMGIKPKDMDWIEGQKLSTRRICSIFGIAPELIGDSQNKTYNNQKEARRALYIEAVMPLLDEIKDELNHWLCPLFGEDYFLDYNQDAIEAIRDENAAKWTRILAGANAQVITRNEARHDLGYEALTSKDTEDGSDPDKLGEVTGKPNPSELNEPVTEPTTRAPTAAQQKPKLLNGADGTEYIA